MGGGRQAPNLVPLAWSAHPPARPLGVQGMYTACYGPHGMEVLLLRLGLPEDPPPPGCPIAGPRLEALKIAGDPNVPALK